MLLSIHCYLYVLTIRTLILYLDLAQFSFTRKHDEFDNLKASAPCIFYLEEDEGFKSYIGIARSKRAVSTIDSAIKITDAVNIVPNSLEKLGQIINKKHFKTLFKQRTEKKTVVMPPNLSIELINCLYQ